MASVRTIAGDGVAGDTDRRLNDPYGLAFGPDGALYVCEVGNHRVRRVDLGTGAITPVAGTGTPGHTGDGGPATGASLNAPHELAIDGDDLFIAERDNHAVRRIDLRTGVITTLAGTGRAGFGGDGGPAVRASLDMPHGVAVAPGGDLLVCDLGNHRVRRIDRRSGRIHTWAGTGAAGPTPDGALLTEAPLHHPRSIAVGPDGTLFLALSGGHRVLRIDPGSRHVRHLAGTGATGSSGDGGPAGSGRLAGPKGLSVGPGRILYVADTENHVIRAIDLTTGIIRTVLGTGEPGDGPEPDPMRCRLDRPHAVLADALGRVYVADSEAHRVRRWEPGLPA